MDSEVADTNQHEARDLYLDGVEAARKGRRSSAQHLLRASLALDAQNAQAWLWLAGVVDSPEESIRYLERVLQLVPNEPHALEGIKWAKRRIKGRKAGEDAATSEQDLFAAGEAAPESQEIPSPERAAPQVKNRSVRWLWGALLVVGLCLMCASVLSLLSGTGFYSQIRQGGGGPPSDSDEVRTTTSIPARTPQVSPSAPGSSSRDLPLPLTPSGYVTPTLALSGESEAPETLTPSPKYGNQIATPTSSVAGSPSPGT